MHGKTIKYRPIYFIVYVIGTFLGLISLLVLEANLNELSIMDTFLKWEWVYSPSLGENLYSFEGFQTNLTAWIYVGILVLVLLLGILGFWESKYFAPQFGWSLIVLFLSAMQYNCPASQNMNRTYFLSVFLSVLAGGGLQVLFTKDKETVAVEEIKLEPTDEVEVVAENEPEKPQIEFIPNPLPLPKKHVKKTMGYGFEVEMDQMCFDIDVSEDDDFDI